VPEATNTTPVAPAAPQAQLPLEPQTPEAVATNSGNIKRRFEIPDEKVEDVAAPAAPAAPAAKTASAEGTPEKAAQDNGEQAPPAEPEGDQPEKKDETPEQAAKREGRRFERRLDKAYRKAAEAQARSELLEKQLSELRQPKAPEGAPKLEDFDYDPEKYATAKAEFAKKQAVTENEEKQRTERTKLYRDKILSDWEEKVDKASDKIENFDANFAMKLKPETPFFEAMMEAENGAEILHYLGSHPKEAQRISALQPVSQVREIGKLEAKLAAKPAEPKTPSKAPAPIAPLSGAAQVTTDVPSDDDDTADWIRKRQKQVHGSRRF
jgi:hypothetical protein